MCLFIIVVSCSPCGGFSPGAYPDFIKTLLMIPQLLLNLASVGVVNRHKCP